MIFDADIKASDFTAEVRDAYHTVFAAVQDAIDNPTDIIEIHLFDSETKDVVEDLLNDLTVYHEEVDNIELVLETVHQACL